MACVQLASELLDQRLHGDPGLLGAGDLLPQGGKLARMGGLDGGQSSFESSGVI